MKYGIILYRNTKNLDDDIQTYAAKKFLPNIDYVIDREKLDIFTPKIDEKVSVIMNGWFNHDKTSILPSPYINPLYISTRFTDNLENKKNIYMDDSFFEYLKKYEPIGLRDDLIKEYLDEAGVENYFSGCVTLTIEKFKNVKKNNNVCLVDVPPEIEYKLKDKKIDYFKTTHNIRGDNYSSLSFEERMQNVENQLKLYQGSKLVITTRLHVALPCLAIGANVLLIYDDKERDIQNRLGKYIEFINYQSISSFIKKPKLDAKNKNTHLKIKTNIIGNIEKFINSNSSSDLLKTGIDVELFKKIYVVPKERITLINNDKVNKLEKRIIEKDNYIKILSFINKSLKDYKDLMDEKSLFFMKEYIHNKKNNIFIKGLKKVKRLIVKVIRRIVK